MRSRVPDGGTRLGTFHEPDDAHAERVDSVVAFPGTGALVDLVADGRYRPTVTCCVPFDKVPDALTDLAARRTMGRVVVDVRA